MRGRPDTPAAPLGAETEMRGVEREREREREEERAGALVSLYQILPWHMVTEVRGRKARGQSVKLSENTVVL